MPSLHRIRNNIDLWSRASSDNLIKNDLVFYSDAIQRQVSFYAILKGENTAIPFRRNDARATVVGWVFLATLLLWNDVTSV